MEKEAHMQTWTGMQRVHIIYHKQHIERENNCGKSILSQSFHQ